MTTEKLVAAKVEAMWEFLTAYRDRKCTLRASAEEVWDAAVRKHIPAPAAQPAPELRWPPSAADRLKARAKELEELQTRTAGLASIYKQDRDKLAADAVVMKAKIENFEKWVKSLKAELRAAKKPGRAKRKGAKR